jgi:hypothetical protein
LTAFLQQTYSEAPEAAFFVVFFADEAAAAGAADAATGAEACANAAVAKRPATRAAISLFIL